jgi:hypothetical protein
LETKVFYLEDRLQERREIPNYGEDDVFWEWISAVITAFASLVGSAWVIRAVVKHEEKACDARLEAFKEGLHEKDH